MKILDLLEAINFRSNERARIMRYASAFRVGLELEFTYLDDEAVIHDFRDDIIENSRDEARDNVYHEIDDIVSTFQSDMQRLYIDNEEFLKIISFEEKEDFEDYVGDVEDFRESDIVESLETGDIYDVIKDVSKSANLIFGEEGEDVSEYIEEALDEISDFHNFNDKMGELLKFLEDNEADILKHWKDGQFYSFPSELSDFAHDILEVIALSEFDYSDLPNYLLDEGYLDDYIEEEIDRMIANDEVSIKDIDNMVLDSGIHQVEEYIESEGLSSLIYEVTVDPSVKRGIEVVTEALPLDEFVTNLEDLLNIVINNGGVTDETTGLHVNISHRSFKTDRIENIDFLKMVALLDPDFMQNRTSAAVKEDGKDATFKWKERNDMVSALMRVMDSNVEDYVYIARDHGYGDELLERIRQDLIQAEKYRSINFTSAFLGTSPDQRRIEFRFPGGSGYEDRKADIEDDVLFFCYCILLAIHKDYSKEEYHKSMLRYLNRSTERAGLGKDFLSVVRDHKRGGGHVEMSSRLRYMKDGIKDFSDVLSTWSKLVKSLDSRLSKIVSPDSPPEVKIKAIERAINFLIQVQSYKFTRETIMMVSRERHEEEFIKELNSIFNSIPEVLHKHIGDVGRINPFGIITSRGFLGDIHSLERARTNSIKVLEREIKKTS